MIDAIRKTVNDANIIKRLYLKVENSVASLRDMLNFFCFIFDKTLTQFEREKLFRFNNDDDKFLIILPFVAIKGTNDSYEFTYY